MDEYTKDICDDLREEMDAGKELPAVRRFVTCSFQGMRAVLGEIDRLQALANDYAHEASANALKLQHWRTDEPPRSVLLLVWVRGIKEHSGAMWTREGYWLMPWHGDDGWAAQFRNAACKHLDADTLDVVGWMPLPEPPHE